MMMSLDMFVFEIGTAPYQELQRRTDWRFAQNEKLGARAATQFLGAGVDAITLNGTLYPGQIGKYGALDTLRELAKAGEAYALVSGTGDVLGDWFIRSIDETQSIFFVDGVARKSDFSMNIERFDNG